MNKPAKKSIGLLPRLRMNSNFLMWFSELLLFFGAVYNLIAAYGVTDPPTKAMLIVSGFGMFTASIVMELSRRLTPFMMIGDDIRPVVCAFLESLRDPKYKEEQVKETAEVVMKHIFSRLNEKVHQQFADAVADRALELFREQGLHERPVEKSEKHFHGVELKASKVDLGNSTAELTYGSLRFPQGFFTDAYSLEDRIAYMKKHHPDVDPDIVKTMVEGSHTERVVDSDGHSVLRGSLAMDSDAMVRLLEAGRAIAVKYEEQLASGALKINDIEDQVTFEDATGKEVSLDYDVAYAIAKSMNDNFVRDIAFSSKGKGKGKAKKADPSVAPGGPVVKH